MLGLIRYIVMWWLCGEIFEECFVVCFKVKILFEGFKGQIDGFIYIEVGVDVSVVDYVCDVVLFLEFIDQVVFVVYVNYFEYLCVCEVFGDLWIGCFQVDYFI